MGQVARNLAQLRANIERGAQEALDLLAVEAENILHDDVSWSFWVDDTGAARGSITGFNPEVSSFDKNFGDPDWVAARTGAKESKYTGWPYFITPANYTPHLATIGKPHAYEAYLTMFVKYAPEISLPREAQNVPGAPPSEEVVLHAFRETMELAAIASPRIFDDVMSVWMHV